MKFFSVAAVMLSIGALLSSCDLIIHHGEKKDKLVERSSKDSVNQDGTILYNGIHLTVHNLKVSRAFLVFDNNERVPSDNKIDFTSPVRTMIQVDSGWVEETGQVYLDAAEKITMESGKVIADQQDLYKDAYPYGVDAATAKKIWLMADIHPRNSTPGFFYIEFKVKDKKGDGYIEGNYKLYPK